jgi:hypothetical protein
MDTVADAPPVRVSAAARAVRAFPVAEAVSEAVAGGGVPSHPVAVPVRVSAAARAVRALPAAKAVSVAVAGGGALSHPVAVPVRVSAAARAVRAFPAAKAVPSGRVPSLPARRSSAPQALSTAVQSRLVPLVAGPVLQPHDAGYGGECATVRLGSTQRPAVIVGAMGAADVIAAVAFATERGLPVAVRSTGHAATPLPAEAVLISTRRMQGVHVDPMARTAQVAAGVRWERVIHEAAPFGLAPLAGSSPHVGAVGYTMGGGLGPLGRAFGYAADHVSEIDIVTAGGTLRRATASQLVDLFWAVRGGKDNFGVVTSMQIALFPVRSLYGGGLYFPGSSAAQVLHAYRRWVATVPDQMSSSYALNRFPMTSDVPEQLRGLFTVHVRIAYCGEPAEGERLVRPLRAVAVPLWDTLAEMPFNAVGSIHNDPEPRPEVCESSTLLATLDEDAVDALVGLVGPDRACPLSFVELRHLGGALSRRPEVPNAVGHREAAFQLYTAGTSELVGQVRDYAELVVEQMAHWSTGATALNFIGSGEVSAAAVRAAYSSEDYRRLVQVKRAYDPENIFRANHNIQPRPDEHAGPR